ncbi:MAG: hypothetical protein AB7T49_10190 [Oligoflexales bacterium]
MKNLLLFVGISTFGTIELQGAPITAECHDRFGTADFDASVEMDNGKLTAFYYYSNKCALHLALVGTDRDYYEQPAEGCGFDVDPKVLDVEVTHDKARKRALVFITREREPDPCNGGHACDPSDTEQYELACKLDIL